MNKEERVKVDNCVINEKDLEVLEDFLKNGFTFRKDINEVLIKVISYFEKYNDEKVLGLLTKEERVKLVFETISKIAGFEIKPDKEFYMIIDGVKSTYKVDELLNLHYKTPHGSFRSSMYNILPILNGGCKLEEHKEPLLTNEETDFLRQFNFEELKISIYLYLYDKNDRVVTSIDLDNINYSFDGLEKGKRYSREELGL